MRRSDVDVVVVGAGMAGLTCARELARAGLDVVVLEARERVGGRIWTWRDLEDGPLDVGAMFVHGEHASSLEVIREAGLTVTTPPARGGFSRMLVDGAVREMDDVYAEAMVAGLWSLEAEVAAFNGKDRPLREEIGEHRWPPLRQRLALEFFSQAWCADPDELSAEGVSRVESMWTSGSMNFVVEGGYDQLPEHLAKGLDVRLATPVRRVEWSEGCVEVQTAAGRRVSARALVLTTPPPVVAGGLLAFAPRLPEPKEDAASRILLGPAVRIAVRLKRPTPEGGWLAVIGDTGGFWSVWPDTRLLTGWIAGPAAVRVAREPVAKVLSGLVEALPWLDRELIEEVRSVDWAAEPYTLGGYTYPRVGALDAPGVWAEPVDHTLFFAGEATCGDRHPATVHGAMESGLRAGAEVRSALGGER